MKRVVLLMSLSCGFAATLMAGDTFYWTANRRQWADYTDPANWSLVQDPASNPDNRIPSASDYLWTFGEVNSGDYGNYLAYFNLGGGSYTIAGFSNGTTAGTAWKSYRIYLTNGTFTVLNPESPKYPGKSGSANTHGYYIYDSTRFIVPAEGTPNLFGASGLAEVYNIYRGGLAEFHCNVTAFVLRMTVYSGGELIFDPPAFKMGTSSSKKTPSYIENSGILRLPRGLTWEGNAGAASNRLFTVTQKTGGTLHIGGDFTKTVVETVFESTFAFVFSGGTIVATNSVAFRPSSGNDGREVQASMPNDASGTVEVCADSVLDMQLFEYGTGTTLTKVGPGTLVVGNSRPTSLNVTAGTLRLGETMDNLSGITLADGICIEFAAPNSSFAAPVNYATLDFAVDLTSSAMQSGRTIFTSSDADFLAYVKSHVTAHLPLGYKIRQDGTTLVLVQVPAVPTFETEGELDLSNAAGWGETVPTAGADVAVSGPNTVALISATPAYGSIIVYDGATVKVTGTDVDLPAVTLAHPSRLLIAGGVTAYVTNGLTGGGDEFGLPVFEIATNATVTVLRGTKFKNLDFRLYGQIGVPDETSGVASHLLVFGHATASETSYFAMTAVGGTIYQAKNSNGTTTSAAWRRLVSPDSGGRVKVQGKILLKDVTFGPTASTYNGIAIGMNNPVDEPFEVVLDGTTVPLSRGCYFGGSATVRSINGGELWKNTQHPGVATTLLMSDNARFVAEGAQSRIYYSYADKGHFTVNPAQDAFEAITLRNGAYMSAHETAGNGRAMLVVSNAAWCIPTLPYIPKDRNPNPPNDDPRNWMTNSFNGLKAVHIETESTMYLMSADTLDGTKWNRDVKLANVPMTGAGDLVMTNGTPGYTFRATVVAANNTATGEAKAVCGTGGDATTLLFNDGANWAGTVVAGNVALTNVTDGSAAATVNFDSLRMDGDFPVRIWATTNDMVNIATSLQDGGGDFRPVLMPGRAALEPGESFTFGTFAAGATIPRRIGHWILSSTPAANPAFVTVSLRYMPPGTTLLFR